LILSEKQTAQREVVAFSEILFLTEATIPAESRPKLESTDPVSP
jgi:hypothetical protein